MLIYEQSGVKCMSVPTGRLLHFCARDLKRATSHRSITTTCLRHNTQRSNSQQQTFLGSRWEHQKLVRCLRAHDSAAMESGLVKGASVVGCNCCLALPQLHAEGSPQAHMFQMWADSQALKLQRRAHIMWDQGGPKTVFIVKKTGSAKTTAKLKEIAAWYEALDSSTSNTEKYSVPSLLGMRHVVILTYQLQYC